MDDSKIRRRADELIDLLIAWISALPEATGSASLWYRDVLKGDKDLRIALGFRGSDSELKAARVALASDLTSWRQYQTNVSRRMQIYLGGAEGLATSNLTPTPLRDLANKLHEIRVALSISGKTSTRPDRTLTKVSQAIAEGTLKELQTDEPDSGLWVVLKTLQENFRYPSRFDELDRLVSWVAHILTRDAENPGKHIADRRHAWWAVRTLFEAEELGVTTDIGFSLPELVRRLLREPVYTPNDLAVGGSLVPDMHERLSVAWELVNISELVRGWSGALTANVLAELIKREDALMSDLVDAEAPTDLRLATVHVRACLTYLSDPVPSLWGRDV